MEKAKDLPHFPSFLSLGREVLGIPAVVVGSMRKPEPVLRPDSAADAVSGGQVPVLVIPGLLTGDGATALLRCSLDRSGYKSFGWDQGVNYGVRPDKLDRLTARLETIAEKHQRKPIVIGWSLGGLYARAIGGRSPNSAGMIVTLGTPFSGDRRANHAWRLYEILNGHKVDDPPVPDDPSVKPKAQTIAIWARGDGVVDPSCARGLSHESDEQIAFDASHMELGASRCCVREIISLLHERVDRFC